MSRALLACLPGLTLAGVACAHATRVPEGFVPYVPQTSYVTRPWCSIDNPDDCWECTRKPDYRVGCDYARYVPRRESR